MWPRNWANSLCSVWFWFIYLSLDLYWGHAEPKQLSKLLLNEMAAIEGPYFVSPCSEQELSSLNVINERFEVFVKNSEMLEASGKSVKSWREMYSIGMKSGSFGDVTNAIAVDFSSRELTLLMISWSGVQGSHLQICQWQARGCGIKEAKVMISVLTSALFSHLSYTLLWICFVCFPTDTPAKLSSGDPCCPDYFPVLYIP